MLSVSWTQHRQGDVTLVEVVVASDAPTPRRGRLDVRMDGPIWPPRRRGVPEAGWDDGRFETVVPPGGRVAVGFASPAPPADPPVELVGDERAPADIGRDLGEPFSTDGMEGAASPVDGMERAASPVDGMDDRTSTTAVVRSLADSRPPRDAVPVAPLSCDGGRDESRDDRCGHDSSKDRCDGESPDDQCDDGSPNCRQGDDSPVERLDRADGKNGSATVAPETVPGAVRDWLATVERRGDRAAAIARATALPATARAVESAGGLSGVESLEATLQDDAAALRAVAARATELADDCDAAAGDLPIAALRRFA